MISSRRFFFVVLGALVVLTFLFAFVVAKPVPKKLNDALCEGPSSVAAPNCDTILGTPTGSCTPGQSICKSGASMACIWRCGYKKVWVEPGEYCFSGMCNTRSTACQPRWCVEKQGP